MTQLTNNTSISLRQFNLVKDISLFYKVHSDIPSMEFYGMSSLRTHAEASALIEAYIHSEQEFKSIHRVICDSQNGEYIGEIGLFNINHLHHRANSYCILLPQYRKKGISIKASSIFFKYVYNNFDINRIQALIDTRNKEARLSLIGIGYNYEGVLHQYEYFNGDYIDIEIFSLLKTDFYNLYG